ncbi:MAG: hypothetical protein J5732_09585 [Bacteroidaceae bacterium]|nr:hypothetical protein [Bacteroidaceae bacterium]
MFRLAQIHRFAAVATIAAVLALAASSCLRQGEELRRLTAIEPLLEHNPDSARVLLDGIDPSGFRGESLALYALLKTQADYKCYVDIPSDSLIRKATAYYGTRRKDIRHKVLSHYYHGCVLFNDDRLPEAAVSLTNAENQVEELSDPLLSGLLFSQIADVFYYSFDFVKAILYFQKARDCYIKADDKEEYVVYAGFDIGKCYLEECRYEKAYEIFNEVAVSAKKLEDSLLYSDCIVNMATSRLEMYDIDGAEDIIAAYFTDNNGKTTNLPMLLNRARVCIYRNRLQEAAETLDTAWKAVSTLNDSVRLWSVTSNLQEKLGNTDSAFACFRHMTLCQNRNLRPLLLQPVVSAQKDYYLTLSELRKNEVQRKKDRLLFLAILGSMAFLAVFIWFCIKKRKADDVINENISIICELTTADRQKSEKMKQMSDSVRTMFRRQYEFLDKMCVDYYEGQVSKKERDHIYVMIMKKVEEITSPESIAELDRLINDTYDSILEHILNSGIKLQEQELMLLRLMFVGYSTKAISVITGLSIQNIYQKKTRIMKKIAQHDSELANEISKSL